MFSWFSRRPLPTDFEIPAYAHAALSVLLAFLVTELCMDGSITKEAIGVENRRGRCATACRRAPRLLARLLALGVVATLVFGVSRPHEATLPGELQRAGVLTLTFGAWAYLELRVKHRASFSNRAFARAVWAASLRVLVFVPALLCLSLALLLLLRQAERQLVPSALSLYGPYIAVYWQLKLAFGRGLGENLPGTASELENTRKVLD